VLFSLIGFTQDSGFRVFAFEGVAADRSRTAFTIRADLALTRKYGIPVQDLPLLCRGILERTTEGEQPAPEFFTEDDMRLHARTCAAARSAAIEKRKIPRKHPTGQSGGGWRVPHDNTTKPSLG
jgi:hypothetical protein